MHEIQEEEAQEKQKAEVSEFRMIVLASEYGLENEGNFHF